MAFAIPKTPIQKPVAWLMKYTNEPRNPMPYSTEPWLPAFLICSFIKINCYPTSIIGADYKLGTFKPACYFLDLDLVNYRIDTRVDINLISYYAV